MSDLKIQQIFNASWYDYSDKHTVSEEQLKAALSIMACKSGALGCNISVCDDCGHQEIHNNSCRNRHCPNCQAVLKEMWIDARRAEVIDGAYFHVVFTVPAQLRPIICMTHLLRPYWNCRRTRNISVPLRPSSRSFIPGGRICSFIRIFTASSPVRDFLTPVTLSAVRRSSSFR